MQRNKEKRLCLIIIASLLLLTAILSFVTSPLFISLESDIVYQESLAVPALYYFNQIFDELRISAMICLCAICVYIFRELTAFRTVTIISVYAVSFLRYAFNILSTGMSDGFDRLDSDDFFSPLFSFGLEAIIFTLTLIISSSYTKRHFEKAEVLSKAYLLTQNTDYDERVGVYPYSGFIKPKAMITGPVFWGCITAFAEKFIDTLIYDIDLGLPEDFAEAADMVQMYLGLVVLLALSYTFAYFLSACFLKIKN